MARMPTMTTSPTTHRAAVEHPSTAPQPANMAYHSSLKSQVSGLLTPLTLDNSRAGAPASARWRAPSPADARPRTQLATPPRLTRTSARFSVNPPSPELIQELAEIAHPSGIRKIPVFLPNP